MSTLTFVDDMARLQRTLAQCQDMVLRRSMVLEALNLRTGEHVLEVGCGGGYYAYEAAQFVGPTGRVCGISPDQVAAAQARCADFRWVECRSADAAAPPYEEAAFDVVYGVQVVEYIPDLDRALHEFHRVLRPGGRLLIFATNWSSLVWYSDQPERMQRVLAAFEAHAPYPDLPSLLPARLRQIGLQPLRQIPVPFLNMSYNANSASYWLARLISAYVVGRNGITEGEAKAWLDEFETLEQEGAYFFCSAPILTQAIKLA